MKEVRSEVTMNVSLELDELKLKYYELKSLYKMKNIECNQVKRMYD